MKKCISRDFYSVKFAELIFYDEKNLIYEFHAAKSIKMHFPSLNNCLEEIYVAKSAMLIKLYERHLKSFKQPSLQKSLFSLKNTIYVFHVTNYVKPNYHWIHWWIWMKSCSWKCIRSLKIMCIQSSLNSNLLKMCSL